MSDRSPQGTLWDLLRGALCARALAIVGELRVSDALAAGPRPVGEVAAEGGADADTLRRTDFWSWLAEHPEERAAFDRSMEQGKGRRIEQLAGLEWRGDETVVDVGGGNGSLLVGLLERHPGLRGIVFDLPETHRDEAALGDRCTFVAGSFFERVPEGDVYVLSTVLHDWDDESAARILRTIRAARGGRLRAGAARAGDRGASLELTLPRAPDPPMPATRCSPTR